MGCKEVHYNHSDKLNINKDIRMYLKKKFRCT